MPGWKQILLASYYYGGLPWRQWRIQRLAAMGNAPLVVLMYHRIAEDQATPWTASFSLFQQQLHWLGSRFELVSLQEGQRRVSSGANHRLCVSLTFDDGYAVNCERALPYLIEQGIPCTYFVTTHHILHGEPFPHDLKRGLNSPPNSIAELRELSAAGIEVGAHTRTHRNLGPVVDEEVLYDEVVAARDDLQRALGAPIRYFAFPYGMHANLNRRVFAICKDAGFLGVCSAYGGYNFPGEDAFHLQRFGTEHGMLAMQNCVQIDPRKCAIRRFHGV